MKNPCIFSCLRRRPSFQRPAAFPVAAAVAAAATLLACVPLPAAQAVLTAGPTGRNLEAPVGNLASAGWEYAGFWGKFAGTAIAPNYFITAAHVGGAVGDTFLYQGENYNVVQQHYIGNSDINVWQVDRSFSSWAPIYTGTAEIGKDLFVYGRSSPRGPEYFQDGYSRGWYGNGSETTGPFGGDELSWGTGIMERTVEAFSDDSWRQEDDGRHLSWGFHASGGPNAGSIYGGDSGGAVFIRDDDNIWKLAGINLGIDGPYSPGQYPAGWLGAFHDARNMYLYGFDEQTQADKYFYIDPALYPDPVPTYSYATRIGTYLNDIRAISPTIAPQNVAVAPEPGTLALLALAAFPAAGLVRRRKRLAA